jgi:lysozyme
MLSYKSRPKLYELLEKDDGFKQFACPNAAGHSIIGIGRNLSARGISYEEAMFMLQNDVKDCVRELLKLYPWVNGLSDVRKIVLISMAFTLGVAELAQFRAMWNALESDDYASAAKHILDSPWAKQSSNRAERLAHFMETDVMP